MLSKGEIWMADWVAELRRELTLRAIAYAQRHNLPHFLSKGGTVFFEPYLDATGVTCHGNFFAPSYQVIRHDPDWAALLNHGVTNANTIPRLKQGMAMETDSSCSTVALTMSLFCLPELQEALETLLQTQRARPLFAGEGKGGNKRKRNRQLEPDVILGGGQVCLWAVLAESLTGAITIAELEQNPALHRYADCQRLAVSGGIVRYADVLKMYLAAQQQGARFVLLADQRRQDIARAYRRVMQAARAGDNCRLITWQELAAAMPAAAQKYMFEKYGIEPMLQARAGGKQMISAG